MAFARTEIKELEPMVKSGKKRFVRYQEGAELYSMGLHTFEPKGAFYVFPNISVLGMNSDDFCMQLLKEQNLAIVPGTAFGESGEGFVRISYAYSIEHLQEAMRRIERFLKDHGYQKEGK